MTPGNLMLTLLVVVVWGLNFVAIKLGVEEMPPLLLTALRFTFTALPMVFFLPRPAVRWSLLAAFGIMLGAIKFGLLFSAIHLGMPAGLSSLVMQLQVFFTMGLAMALMGEQPGPVQLLGAALAFGGVAVLGLGKGSVAPAVPFLMTIAAAMAWGVANMIVKTAGKVDTLAFLVWASLFAPLPLFALSLILDGPGVVLASLAAPSLTSILSLAFIVGPSTLFAFAMWNSLLTRHPVWQVAPFALLVPVVGLFCGAMFLGEALTASALIGSAIVFFGLCINVFGDAMMRRWKAA